MINMPLFSLENTDLLNRRDSNSTLSGLPLFLVSPPSTAPSTPNNEGAAFNVAIVEDDTVTEALERIITDPNRQESEENEATLDSQGYIYKLLIDSNTTEVESISSGSSNKTFKFARTPLQLEDYSFFQYEGNLYVCSPDLETSLNVSINTTRVIQEFNSIGQSIVDLSEIGLDTISKVNTRGLNINKPNPSRPNAVSYTFNKNNQILSISNNDEGSLILYDPVNIKATKLYTSLTPDLTYTLLDYSSIPGIFTIKTIEHKSVIYNKTLDRTRLVSNRLFYNKYTYKAFMIYRYYPGIFN